MSIGAVSGYAPDFSSMRAHFQEMRAQKFEAADTDGSGGLSLEELGAARANSPFGSANIAGAPSTEEIFSKLDADGDGVVTSEEFTSAEPPARSGNFSPEALSTLLAAQEDSGSSILDVFLSESQEDNEGETDLLGQLLESLEESETD